MNQSRTGRSFETGQSRSMAQRPETSRPPAGESPAYSSAASGAGMSMVQQVEEGKRRLAELQMRRTRAMTIVETERARLAEAEREAQEQFGVSTLEELRTLCANMVAENRQKTAVFLEELAKAEEQMNEVDRQLNG